MCHGDLDALELQFHFSTITARREKEGEGERMVDALSKIFDFTIINIRSVSSESEYGKKLVTFVLA